LLSPTQNILLHHEIHRHADEQAPWVLFIHGAGGSTRTWRKQIEPFGAEYNLLLIDLPGHAQSREATLLQKHYDFEWIGNKIWEVADHIQIQKLHLVGVSLGSIIAMQMQHSKPHRVHSMLFSGPIVGLNRKLRILARTGLALAKVIGFQNFYAVTARLTLPRKNHKKSREIFVRESKFISDDEYRKWTAMYGKCLDDTLLRLFDQAPAVPMYFLIGSQDHLFKEPAFNYAKRFPAVKTDIADRCGHLVSLEKSAWFNERCLIYLRVLNDVKPG
jgi:pimeloyl-ACP methyl ester carboxylesterase